MDFSCIEILSCRASSNEFCHCKFDEREVEIRYGSGGGHRGDDTTTLDFFLLRFCLPTSLTTNIEVREFAGNRPKLP
jgi:hypothetical protein